MKILWLCNRMPLKMANCLGRNVKDDISWVSSVLDELQNKQEHSVYVLFPQNESMEALKGNVDNIHFIGFYQDEKLPWKTNTRVEKVFKEILQEVQPDIIHIWGTEYAHSLDMVRAADEEQRKKIVVHIQGLISVYAEQYMADLPLGVRYGYTFRDFVRNDNVRGQQQKFFKRGKNEIELLHMVSNVMGRTDWDKAHCLNINPKLVYHHCKESMRKDFFEYTWDVDKAEKYTLFITQGTYPVKGFHYLLEALSILVKEFPQIRVRVTGTNIMVDSKARVRESSYSRYIRKYIEKNDLEQYIEFLGYQDVQGMAREFMRANAFVLPSAVENSPNSLAEAAVVGVPSVASDVGGVSNMMQHGKEGFVYQHNDPVMLAFYIARIFRDTDLAREMSSNARERAGKDYSAVANLENLLKIYQNITEQV